MRSPLLILIIIAWLGGTWTWASNATAGLFVCTDNDGMDNIVSAAKAASHSGKCQPYQKGMLAGQTTSSKTSPTPTTKTATPLLAPSKPPATTLSLSPPKTTQATTQATTPKPSSPSPDITVTSSSASPSTTSTRPKRVLLTGQSARPGEEVVNLDDEPSLETLAQPRPPVSSLDSPTTETAQIATNAQTNAIEKIFMCPAADGTHSVFEAKVAPRPDCVSFGVKGGQAPTPQSEQTPTTDTSTLSPETNAGNVAIATTAAPPQDIYKCFDDDGLVSYVGANEREHFHHCSFFSRSFAGVKQDLQRQALTTPSLTQLAIQGVSKQEPTAKAALRCTGAGEVVFNGQTKTYNCATRSFDHTPGSTGGSVQLGDRQATIAGHRLDYFGSEGSCGGEVLAENGRTLHLVPTKECPEAFQIEARRIAAVVEKSLSIPVTGAFKERQRQLAPQINEIANRIGVDPYLVHAVISAESAYKHKAVSHAGARGLMQLMPATADRFGVKNSFHTGENIRGGTTYLKWLLKEFNGNLELALAGYNAGEGNVRKYGYKIPPFIETRAYVPKVLQYYRRYRSNPAEVGL